MAPDEARAVWFPRARAVEIRPESLPSLGPDDVRIRAIASAISQGTEMLVYRGQVAPDLPLDLPPLRGSFGFPIKYGYASVGRVVEVGSAVDTLQRGELTFALHPHQTEYVVPSGYPARLPAGLDPERGVFLANLETAVNVALDAAPRLGERVLVSGLGVVGLLITQAVQRTGVDLVIGVDPVTRRRDLAATLGVAHVFEPGPDLVPAVRELTGGQGVDIAVEVSGQGAALDAAIAATAFQGTVVVASWYGTKPVAVTLGGPFHRGRVRLVSSQVGAIDPALQPRWTFARRLDLARSLLETLDLTPLISHRIPFEQAAEAYDLVDRRGAETVQVVLTYPTG